jgi:hypothetical protein
MQPCSRARRCTRRSPGTGRTDLRQAGWCQLRRRDNGRRQSLAGLAGLGRCARLGGAATRRPPGRRGRPGRRTPGAAAPRCRRYATGPTGSSVRGIGRLEGRRSGFRHRPTAPAQVFPGPATPRAAQTANTDGASAWPGSPRLSTGSCNLIRAAASRHPRGSDAGKPGHLASPGRPRAGRQADSRRAADRGSGCRSGR